MFNLSINKFFLKIIRLISLILVLILALNTKNSYIYALIDYKDKVQINQFSALKHPHYIKNLKIKKAAKAVVLINNSGTGSFVRYQNKNYLMTNNHILGSKNCAASGCFVNIKTNYQFNNSFDSVDLFVVPIAARSDMDIALFRFSKIKEKTKNNYEYLNYQPEYLLTLNESNQDVLSNYYYELFYMIGHPRAGLKKISTGKIIKKNKGYIYIDAFSLPGNSGSPILDHNAQIVGIHHSSRKRNDMFTKSKIVYLSRGSSLQTLKKIFKAAHMSDINYKKSFVNINRKISFEKAKKNYKLYIQARKIPKLTDNSNFFDKLYYHCKNNINLKTLNFDLYKKSHKSCTIAKKWINHCNRNTKKNHQYFQKTANKSSNFNSQYHADYLVKNKKNQTKIDHSNYCSVNSDSNLIAKFKTLFQLIANGYDSFVGGTDQIKLWPSDINHELLILNKKTAKFVLDDKKINNLSIDEIVNISDQLSNYKLNKVNKIKNFNQINNKKFQRIFVQYAKNMLINYKSYIGYEYYLESIARIAFNLYKSNKIPRSLYQNSIINIQKDPNLTLYAKLAIEKMLYNNKNYY